MQRKTLPRHLLSGGGWAHPYGHGPFSPFLYADGGDGDGSGSGSGDTGGTGDGSGDGTGDGSGSGDGDDTGQGAGDSSAGKGSGQSKDGEDDAARIRRLEKELTAARQEAGKSRNDAKKQAAQEAKDNVLKEIGKLLGFVKDDGPPDPAKLAEQITAKDTTIAERDATIRTKEVELAVWARADKLAARAGALLDSRSFLRDIADLDPSAKGFTTALDDAIKAAVKDNPAFAAAQSAGKSGGDLSGGTGEGKAKKRSSSLSGAVGAHYQT
ncbi:hypothetical protein [Streptomyces spiralis]